MKTKRGFLHSLFVIGLILTFCFLCFVLIGNKITSSMYPQKYKQYVTYYADKYEIDPLMVYSFIRTESNFNPDAVSDVDARGLMQITEETFDWIKGNIAPDEALTFDDMFDPETNIRFGCYFVSYCLLRYDNDLPTVAAAYHSGWGTVDELLSQKEYSSDGNTLQTFPYPQMRQYVKKITDAYQTYQKIYSNS